LCQKWKVENLLAMMDFHEIFANGKSASNLSARSWNDIQ